MQQGWTVLDCFSKHGAYITHNETQSLEAVYQVTCSLIWSYKKLHTTFVIYAVVLPLRPVNTL